MTATYSLNFCSAVKKSLKIITSNVIRVAVVNKITDFVLFLSNLCITFSVAVLGFYFFTGKIPIDALTSLIPQLNFYVVPLLIVIIGSYCVNRLFFDVFAFGVDTILMCALIDIDENDGTSSRPYYMSTALQNILNGKKHN
ncbi:unnamed protein product [Brachionus calyciflorus]|nr:unnamed protein product [Brachionus calyciflorus]